MLRIVEGPFVQWNGSSNASHSHIVGLLNAMTIDNLEALPPRPPVESASAPCRIKGRTREGPQVSPPASPSAAHQTQPRRSE